MGRLLRAGNGAIVTSWWLPSEKCPESSTGWLGMASSLGWSKVLPEYGSGPGALDSCSTFSISTMKAVDSSASLVACVWHVMTHAQKPDFVFLRHGRVHLNRRGRQLSRLLAAEVCAPAVVILYTPCSEVVWRVLANHSIRQFPLHFPTRASPCNITFQLDCNTRRKTAGYLGRGGEGRRKSPRGRKIAENSWVPEKWWVKKIVFMRN